MMRYSVDAAESASEEVKRAKGKLKEQRHRQRENCISLETPVRSDGRLAWHHDQLFMHIFLCSVKPTTIHFTLPKNSVQRIPKIQHRWITNPLSSKHKKYTRWLKCIWLCPKLDFRPSKILSKSICCQDITSCPHDNKKSPASSKRLWI